MKIYDQTLILVYYYYIVIVIFWNRLDVHWCMCPDSLAM